VQERPFRHWYKDPNYFNQHADHFTSLLFDNLALHGVAGPRKRIHEYNGVIRSDEIERTSFLNIYPTAPSIVLAPVYPLTYLQTSQYGFEPPSPLERQRNWHPSQLHPKHCTPILPVCLPFMNTLEFLCW
jgi:hypothetical protein